MPARSVCLVTLTLSEAGMVWYAGPGRFGGQVHGIRHTHLPYHAINDQQFRSTGRSYRLFVVPERCRASHHLATTGTTDKQLVDKKTRAVRVNYTSQLNLLS